FIMNNCHLVAYRDAGFNPVAIASRDRERCNQAADRHGIPKRYTDWRELVRDPQVEVLDIALPPNVQPDVIREAVRERSHIRAILAQKPFGMDFAQARELVERCEDAGV